jgi:transposase
MGSGSMLALEAFKRIDALFDIERDINDLSAAKRLAARPGRSAPRDGHLLQGA